MLRTFTLLLFLLASWQAHSQTRTISGTLHDTDGSPLPGVNVIIKGTQTGTVTNADGYYSIQAPVGSTLVFAFIGMQTREVVVSPENFKTPPRIPAQKRIEKPQPSLYAMLFKDSTTLNTPGVTVLSDKTPSYTNRANVAPERIKAIRRVGQHYTVVANDPNPVGGISGQFTNTVSFETINKLPSLQNVYAQGRPQGGSAQWQGPDNNEIFSWGPLLRTLEYDGSVYPYDRQGRLVTAGTGSGASAAAYDASVFRTAISTSTELQLTVPSFKKGNISVSLENRNRQGILPNAHYTRQNASLSLRNVQLCDRTKLQGLFSYNHSSGRLMNRGANLATIVGSIYRTPPTFDNANGLQRNAALHSTEAYRLADGSVRSHAPELVDNPYDLLSNFPDREKQNRLLANLNLQRTEKPFGYLASASIEKQQNDIVHGFPIGYAGFADGRITHRVDDQTLLSAMVSPTYKHPSHDLKVNASYVVNAEFRKLNRTDGTRFREGDYSLEAAGMRTQMQQTPSRTSHELSVNLQERYEDFILLKLANRSYFSNTAPADSYTNFFPTASLSVDLANKLYIDQVDLLRPYVSLSRTLHEAPLIYNNWSYLSTRQTLQAYNTFNESTELFFPSGLAPETTRKLETGVRLDAFRYFSFEFSYFNFQTDNFVSPIYRNGHFALGNAASISNTGASVALAFNSSNWNQTYWGVDLKWSTYNNVVDALATTDPFIALAGFESVASVLAPGKPVGALYGTTFQRNENGDMIIGADGFPLVDNTLKMIGNPQPDWVLGFTSFLNIHQFKISTTLDFKHGGQAWNGTARMLDYLGKSATTAELRNTSAYVFEGVNEQGQVNTQSVNFADPSQPVASNRWVRYGWAGVGEEYIQNASWFRMSELSLSYATPRVNQRQFIKEARFSLVGRNLFLVTPYEGVDPSSTLFGYATGSGLDLFNTPSTRSFSAIVTLLF
ncbi:TonB-dependent receptor [Chryseolinea lacunae]|uniref:Carboxypeptidase-like regulatory domain-containing protein n=1 Tax=Chryseolinea lacunae TaxID=2801331 RepID=A0ABS1KUD8_9BACT|nr:TonB-dependent receptor [Chryseolinea lacunae]MBL0743103.1 carboxypeptidase-like regulatory domain-containing protein [Chryseolinea lacunae]